ncbi:unnamed protein product [Closterium sp. NIES-54]
MKQSPLLWYKALDDVLTGADWKKIQVDEALYFKVGDDGLTCWLLVYVDDLLAASSSLAMLKELKELLEDAFELCEIKSVEKYPGLEIVHDRPARKLWLHQQFYVDKLRRHFIDKEQTGRVPKTLVPVDAYAELTFDDKDAQSREVEEYRQKIDRCLHYLADTRDAALEFGGGPELLRLVGYADADDKQNRTSMGGYVFVFGGAAIAWSSQRIKCAMLSSTESEYVVASEGGKEACRLCFLAEFQLLDAGKPTMLHVDNQSAITLVEGLGIKGNLKHMERRYAWLQHMVKRRKISLQYIPTTEQPADFFMKALHFPAFNRCSNAIGQVRLADVGDGDDEVQQ